MYSSIDNLVQQCGRPFITDLLPSLFIKINTSSVETSQVFLDLDYNGSSVSDINNITKYVIDKKLETNSKLTFEIMSDLATVIELFNSCISNTGSNSVSNSVSNTDIGIDTVDYIVFSYLGKFEIRLKNTASKNNQFGKSFYLDIQTVRISLIDEQTKRAWAKYYTIFNNGFKVVGGYIIFRYVLNFFNFTGLNSFNFNRLIGR